MLAMTAFTRLLGNHLSKLLAHEIEDPALLEEEVLISHENEPNLS